MEPIMLHVSDGGTGITNFGRAKLWAYEEAIEKFGKLYLVIVKQPIGPCNIPTDYSLHRIDGKREDLTEFWNIFDQILENYHA